MKMNTEFIEKLQEKYESITNLLEQIDGQMHEFWVIIEDLKYEASQNQSSDRILGKMEEVIDDVIQKGFREFEEKASNQSSATHPEGNCDDPTCPCSLMQPNQE